MELCAFQSTEFFFHHTYVNHPSLAVYSQYLRSGACRSEGVCIGDRAVTAAVRCGTSVPTAAAHRSPGTAASLCC